MSERKIQEGSVADKAIDLLLSINAERNLGVAQNVYVSAVMNFFRVRGDEGIIGLAGFYKFALYELEDQEQNRAIRNVFAHDLNGADDQLLEPKSSGYVEYFTEEKV